MENLIENAEQYLIPIDKDITEFSLYLNSVERAMLSAKFGDGKSSFLSKFAEANADRYTFFTIYPLNYQVAENRDIFEYIKRDLLMQLLSYVELDDEEYSDLLMLWAYYDSNKLAIIQDIIDCVPNVNLGVISVDAIKTPIQKLLSNIARFRDFKEKIKAKRTEAQIESYLQSFDDCRGSIYEFDVISQTICSIIKTIKQKNPNKQVILIVEDLDRIDPAHIFRVLNILSAHIERSRPGLVEFDATNGSNKFDLDKILLICDYSNIKSIYHHLYGKDADFSGYISKFSSQSPYNFSLRSLYKEYILKRFDEQLMAYPVIMDVVADLISTKYMGNLRYIANNLGVYRIKNEKFDFKGYSHYTKDNRLLKLLYILRTFNIEFREFQEAIPEANRDELGAFVGLSWLLLTIFDPMYVKMQRLNIFDKVNNIGSKVLISYDFNKKEAYVSKDRWANQHMTRITPILDSKKLFKF